MKIYDIINKKKHGGALTDGEIRFAVEEYTDGRIPDYQMSALLMAICCRGMSEEETASLTDAVASSGELLDLSSLGTLTVDKHSTGGVGDKTTLVVAPIAAAMGCKVAKMSGRGLGHTGGTVDKLESFEGFRSSLSTEELIAQVGRIGIAVTGQSANLAPADKKIYALRDVTATVDSIPLITSSVMGKKIASGAHSIVLDVKYGSGSFMKSAEEALTLAEAMVKIGRRCGRRVAALVTDMDSPLGLSVGNALEVTEAVATLRGEGPRDLTELSLSLAAMMAHLALEIPYTEARERAEEALESGAAYAKFKEWISAQGADPDSAEVPDGLGRAAHSSELVARGDGFIREIDTERVGLAAVTLGAGRISKSDAIDHAAGIVFAKKTGDPVARGEVIATLYSNNQASLEDALGQLDGAVRIGGEPPPARPLIAAYIDDCGGTDEARRAPSERTDC